VYEFSIKVAAVDGASNVVQRNTIVTRKKFGALERRYGAVNGCATVVQSPEGAGDLVFARGSTDQFVVLMAIRTVMLVWPDVQISV